MSSSQNTASSSNLNKKDEGQLVKKLHRALDLTSEKFVSSIKFSMVKKLFKPIYKKNSTSLKNIHDQLCLQLKKSISEELDAVCIEQSVDFLLNSLEEMTKNQDPSQPSWRPSGNPDEDLRDHLYPIKVKQKEELQLVLKNLMTSNEELSNSAAINHVEIMHIKKTNDDLHEKYSKIVTSLTGTNLENLQTTMDSIEKS